MHLYKKFLSIILLLLVINTAHSQIAFTLDCFPTRLQFFARESNDSAKLCVSGSIDSAGFDSIECKIIRSNKTFQLVRSVLTYNNGSALFNLSPSIYAGLYEYHIRLYIYKTGVATLIKSADSVVCGDVYMINGQSNSHPSNYYANYSNEYCRSFGIQTDNTNYNSYNSKDTFWGFADGTGSSNFYSGPYMVGVWGLKLMQLLKEKYKMPICIMNGGSGGSSIEYNLEPANKLDLNYTYGRLLYRFTKAGLADKVKAIFWHQGESNSYGTGASYVANFDSLYHSWKRDYPNAKKVYVFQIHHGCGGNTQQDIREVQRTFKYTYNDVEVMSTVGIHEHDGCHYYLDGYYEMAINISRLVARDFYKYTDTLDIKPPNIVKAYYNANHNAINLIFDNTANLIWPADTLGETMKDYLYTNDSIADIKSYSLSGNTLVLKLNKASYDTVITYLPNLYYNKVAYVYEGPYIRNKRGVGALSFYHFPLDSAPPPQANFGLNKTVICSGDSIIIKDQSLYKPTSWQWRIPGANPSSSTQQSITTKFDTSGTYAITLIATNSTGTDSITKNITITVNPIPTIYAGADTSFCAGDNVQLNVIGGAKYLWIPAAGLSSDTAANPIANPTSTTNYIIYATDKNGCASSDTIQINVLQLPQVNAGFDIKLCTQSGIVNLSGSPQGGSWVGQGITGTQFNPKNSASGNYELLYTYTNANQCTQTDTMVAMVINSPTIKIDSIMPVCEGKPFKLSSKSMYVNSILWSTNTGGNFASATDSNTIYNPSQTDIDNGFVQFDILAKGDSICAYSYDYKIAKIEPLPAVPIIYTRNDSLFTNAAYAWQWMLDTAAVIGAIQQFLKPASNGTYRVQVTNKFGCVQISDPYIYVNTGMLNLDYNTFSVYPNPANSEVVIENNLFDANTILQLYDGTGRMVHQQKLVGNRSMINIQNFAKGIYTIRIISNNQLYQKKLLVDR